MKNKNGFTLIELLVVVLIIGILAAVALPQYNLAVLKAKYGRAQQTASDIARAYEFYYIVKDQYPKKFSELDFVADPVESDIMQNNDYECIIQPSYNAIICGIKTDIKNKENLKYVINHYTYDLKRITRSCRATSNTNDIYNRFCQKETGKSASEASCQNNYCSYYYN